jgi:transcriptional regulator with XRE-family HTH domain
MAGFRQLVREAVRLYGGTKQDLARRIGVTPPELSRMLNGPKLADIPTCLRLANATDQNPSALLHAAEHGEAVTLIETLYGSAAVRRTLTPDEGVLLANWRVLTRTHQRAVRDVVAAVAGRDEERRRGPARAHKKPAPAR